MKSHLLQTRANITDLYQEIETLKELMVEQRGMITSQGNVITSQGNMIESQKVLITKLTDEIEINHKGHKV